MRILSLVAVMALAVPAAATAGTQNRDNADQARRGATCVRPVAQKGQHPDPRKPHEADRGDCRSAPAYPEVVDPLPVFIL
jgi:hypothetical protein